MPGTITNTPYSGIAEYVAATPIIPADFDWRTDFEWAATTEFKFADEFTAEGGTSGAYGFVGWDKVEACLLSAVGWTVVDPDYPAPYRRLRRKPPIRHPKYTHMRCVGAKVTPQVGNESRACDNLNDADWEDTLASAHLDELTALYPRCDQRKAKVELTFKSARPMNYFLDGEIDLFNDREGAVPCEWQRYLEVSQKIQVEAVQNTSSGGTMKWATSPVAAQVGQPIAGFLPPHMLRSTANVQAIWRQVPLSFVLDETGELGGGIGRYTQFEYYEGRVNSVPFMGRKAQTILNLTPTIGEKIPSPVRYSDHRTHYYVDVTFNWNIFDPPTDRVGTMLANGHQLVPHTKDDKYYLITTDGTTGGKRLYYEGDISQQFFGYDYEFAG